MFREDKDMTKQEKMFRESNAVVTDAAIHKQ